MEIVTADGVDYIESLPNDFFDLIILDPDYQDWSTLIDRGLLNGCLRVLKPDGNILCFTKQPFDYELRIACNDAFRREIAWTFENGGAWCSPKMPLISTQKIYWLTKSKDFFFNPRTGLSYSENTRDFKRKTKVWDGYEKEGHSFKKSDEGVWLRDHLHFNKPMSGKIPAKPKDLIRVLAKCFCRPDGVCLDPFLGSGTTVKVCTELSLDIYGCDIDGERVMKILDNCFEEVEN